MVLQMEEGVSFSSEPRGAGSGLRKFSSALLVNGKRAELQASDNFKEHQFD